MNVPPKLTAKETLDVIAKMAEEEEALDRIEAMSDEEVERYLVEKGVDLQALDARADAVHAAVQASSSSVAGASPPARVSSPNGLAQAVPQVHERARVSRLRRPVVVSLVTAAAIAAAAAGVTIAAGGVAAVAELFGSHPTPKHDTPDQPQLPPTPPPEAPPENQVAVAEALRREASDSCAAKDWVGCVQRLDIARQKDPEGDRAAGVQKMREEVKAGLAEVKDGGGRSK